MKKHICIGLVLAAIMVVIGMTPYLAQGSDNDEGGPVIHANASSPASAPWFTGTVDTSPPYDTGQYVSIALDLTNGTPYISYYEASHKMLRMAKYVGTGGNCGPNNDWACETVDHANWVGRYSSIAIDPTDDLPIIAYYDETIGALKLAILNAFGWTTKIIDEPLIGNAGQYASLALNSTVKTGVAYYKYFSPTNSGLWYAKYVGGGTGINCSDNNYHCELVDSGNKVGKYASLALDSANRPHIAYYDGGHDMLKYAYYNGSWLKRTILSDSSGQFASLAIDVNNGDLPHIAHYDSASGTLEYAVYVGAPDGNCGINSSVQYEWQCDVIDDIGKGTDPRGISLAIDPAGYPVIAYQSGGSGLMVARPVAALGKFVGNCGPMNLFYTWQCDPISFGIGIGQGDFMSLAVNPAGLSTIAYYGNIGTSGGDLKIAYQQLQTFLPLALNGSSHK